MEAHTVDTLRIRRKYTFTDSISDKLTPTLARDLSNMSILLLMQKLFLGGHFGPLSINLQLSLRAGTRVIMHTTINLIKTKRKLAASMVQLLGFLAVIVAIYSPKIHSHTAGKSIYKII